MLEDLCARIEVNTTSILFDILKSMNKRGEVIYQHHSSNCSAFSSKILILVIQTHTNSYKFNNENYRFISAKCGT